MTTSRAPAIIQEKENIRKLLRELEKYPERRARITSDIAKAKEKLTWHYETEASR